MLCLRRIFFASVPPKKIPSFSSPISNPNPTFAQKSRFVVQRSSFRSSYMASGGGRSEDARRRPFVPLPPSNGDKAELFRGLEAALGSPFGSEPLNPPSNPLIIVISGPSGVGKDAVIKRLQEVREGIHFIVTATSRAKRPGEVDGKDYYFVTKESFLSMIERNDLLEYALVYGEYKGIPKQQAHHYDATLGCFINSEAIN